MKNKALLIIFLCLRMAFPASLTAQHQAGGSLPPEKRIQNPVAVFMHPPHAGIPELKLPESCRPTVLPAVVDNSVNDCFSGIFTQGMFAACQQYTGVVFAFTYEMNRLRGLSGNLPENIYPAHYTYNFFNNADWTQGVSYFHSFEVLRTQGQMNLADYGSEEGMNAWGWPSGYAKYYRGMGNRLKGMYYIPVNTEEGQNTLKHYLYDHLESSPVGGVAIFSAQAPFGSYFRTLPTGTPEEGKPVMTYFDWYATHGGTVIGYNDSIRYDLNLDGRYTNDIDINGDGKVDLLDHEIGGFRIANSYGAWWGDNGFYYVLCSALARPYGAGGILDQSVLVLEPMESYHPQLTMKVSFKTACRNHFRFRAGVSTDTSLTQPEQIMDFPIFNFQGNNYSMQGFDSIPGSDTLEFGLDVSPLLSYAEPGAAVKFFLLVDNIDSLSGKSGEILHLSFINYKPGPSVYPCSSSNIPCITDGTTLASVVLSPSFNKLAITTQSLPPFTPSQPYSHQLESSGGTSPVNWSLRPSYLRTRGDSAFRYFPGSSGAPPNVWLPLRKTALPFSFPFDGKLFDTVWANVWGMVTFDSLIVPFPYTIDDYGMLKTVRGIVAAYSGDYTFGGYPNDSLRITLSPQRAIFRWFLCRNTTSGVATVNVELLLYPDGKFEIRYGDMDDAGIRFPVWTGWATGAGNACDLRLYNDQLSLARQSFVYRPPAGNSIFGISPSGQLTAQNPDPSKIYMVLARAEDAGHQFAEKALQVSTGLGLVHSFAQGWDGKLRYDADSRLDLSVSNRSTQDMQNLRISLYDPAHVLAMQDSVQDISLLQAGTTLNISQALAFRLKTHLPDNSSVGLLLNAQSGSNQWTEEIIFPVVAPDMEISSPRVIDGDNLHLDPGEVAEVEVTLSNKGHAIASGLILNLYTPDTLLRILSDPSLDVGDCSIPGNLKFRFLVRASREITSAQHCTFDFVLEGSNIPDLERTFTMKPSRRSVALASLSPSSVSLEPMSTALTALGVPYDAFFNTAFDPSAYSAVFLLNGTTTNEYLLSAPESKMFSNYLSEGGNLYMEAYSAWSMKDPLPLLDYFNYTSSRVTAFFYKNIKGTSGSPCSGMNFRYLSDVDGSVWDLKPKSGASSFMENPDTPAQLLQIANKKDAHSTIASLLEFGSIFDSIYPSTQQNLMSKYLDFFGINLTGPYPLFHATRTSAFLNDTITLLDDSYPNIVSWQWDMPGASPSSSTERNPVVHYSAHGQFDVSLTVSDGIRSKTLTRKNFISIPWGTGIEQEELSGLGFRPNPASGKVSVSVTGTLHPALTATAIDMNGNQFPLRETATNTAAGNNFENQISLDISGLAPGVYCIRLVSGNRILTGKLIVSRP